MVSMLLAKNWKNESVSSKQEWRIKVYYICLMSKRSVFCHSQLGFFRAMDEFNKCWHPYMEHVFPDLNRILILVDCMWKLKLKKMTKEEESAFRRWWCLLKYQVFNWEHESSVLKVSFTLSFWKLKRMFSLKLRVLYVEDSSYPILELVGNRLPMK